MRRTASTVLALALIAAPLPAVASAGTLSDMQTHWARAQVLTGVAAGYVSGYPDGTFRPDAPITRAEFYKLLGSAIRLEPALSATGFQEERQSPLHWSFAQGYVPAAVSSGLLFPPDYANAFGPDARITRREIVVAAVRALGKEPLVGRSPAALTNPDAAAYPAWLQNYAAIAVGAKIVNGYDDGALGLERNATRAEALVMVQRILDQVTVGLTPDDGPGDPTAIRHPGEGEPTWSWRESSPGRITITNGAAAQDYTFAETVSGLALSPAPGKAVWVRYTADGAGVIARLAKGKLTEVARFEGRTPEPLAVDDSGRLWFSDGLPGLHVAGVDGTVTDVADVRDVIKSGFIDWDGAFWGVSDGRVTYVSTELDAMPYSLEMQDDQHVDYATLTEDGSLWMLLKGDNAKAEAVQMELGHVTNRIALLGPYFGGTGSQARVHVVGRSGPFLWLDTRVTPAGGTERSGGLYRFSLATGEFTRLVLPRSVATNVTAVKAADGGALVQDSAGKFWRLLP